MTRRPSFADMQTTPRMVVEGAERDYRFADEHLLEVFERIDPPLFTDAEMKVVRKRLDPTIERRGRPPRGLPTITSITKRLVSQQRGDIPSEFCKLVACRLLAKRRYTLDDDARQYARTGERLFKVKLIRGLYAEIYEDLEPGCETFVHSHFGEFLVPRNQPRSRQALAVLASLLKEKARFFVPTDRRMLNIIAEDPLRKRRPRT